MHESDHSAPARDCDASGSRRIGAYYDVFAGHFLDLRLTVSQTDQRNTPSFLDAAQGRDTPKALAATGTFEPAR